jgi:hypothetical protein
MNLGSKVKVDGKFNARVVAFGTDVGATVKFSREALARVTDAGDAKYLKRTGGHVFFPPAEFERLAEVSHAA